MNDPPWRIAIERALTLQGHDPASRWVQLATVALDGAPAVRTVVFRGFLPGADTLEFTTDLRSAKAEQLAEDSRAEACWLFRESREQFRLAGRLRLVAEDHPEADLAAARLARWGEAPTSTRLSFSWPDPGAPRAEPRRFRVPAPEPDRPPPTFALLLLEPDRVDHLDLRPDPHARIRYHRPGGPGGRAPWEAVEVNP
ncbi:pyridoxamine 5'-phosphate oxidase family protein [Tautonia plasticadhaerens]|uniref:Pyridoxamine 5'-phosphate oxidase n=1 Tax=Tautonia plasticadhaerens TaxID=2527974 RepID=A0A518HCC6_9BACT|nr:pyridoxamine 5'-phosphate oxidase family protein [Tautonia plasticadhaerens]QDV38490.1 pyridoxamine 5'-phosphate oxidase [Tautonia plasticadhaerens]